MTKKYAQARIETLPVESLKPASYNARTISAEAMRGLAVSLEQFGVLAFPVVNKRKNQYRLIGGHQRVEILKRQGVEHVPCVVVEFDDATERQANFALNNKAIQGDFVPELTRALLSEIQQSIVGTEAASLFADLKLDNLMKQVSRAITSPNRPEPGSGKVADNDVSTVTRSKALSKLGAYYQLGAHHLFCGSPVASSRHAMLSKPADLGVTRVSVPKGEPTAEYLDALLVPLLNHTDGWLYAHTPYAHTPAVSARVEKQAALVSSTLLWVNDDAEPTQPYQDAVVSAALYFRKEGAPRQWFGGLDRGNVFSATRLGKDLPVSCYTDIFLNSAKPKDTILDTNVAAGASVIAAEKLGMRVVGYVWSPREMDVVRRRWTQFVHGDGASMASMAPEVTP